MKKRVFSLMLVVATITGITGLGTQVKADPDLDSVKSKYSEALQKVDAVNAKAVDNNAMLGANGTKIFSSTVWKENGSKARIDIENPSPGKRPGQIHYQDQNNIKYYYNPKDDKLYVGKISDGKVAPKNIQELLSIADVLISDYSSLMFDFALTKRPCFLYVPDLDYYIKNDRKLYFNINELPFIPVRSNDELASEITNFDNIKYEKDLANFFDNTGSFEEGKCCEELEKRLNKVCFV